LKCVTGKCNGYRPVTLKPSTHICTMIYKNNQKHLIMVISNPFEVLNNELSEIKSLLLEMKATQTTKEDFAEYPEFLSRTQAAQMMGVALTTLDRYANDGLLKKHRNGKLVRFKKSEVVQAFKTFQKWQRI
jgi:excisionase family DNA binding protein